MTHERDAPQLSRRQLIRITVAAGGAIAALVGVPAIGFVLSPFLRETKPEWQVVGPVDRFVQGQTVAVTFSEPSALRWSGLSNRAAAWVRRIDGDQFIAFSANCTHLGCQVRWESGASLFMCPCHGGVYYRDGSVAAGPPPRPLVRYQVRVRDGNLELRTIGLPLTTGLRSGEETP